MPQGPTGSSLKVSFKDTLFLNFEGMTPISFLHEDSSENLSGAYVRVYSGGTGGTFYYDVPELPNTPNDTVSTILVGIDMASILDPDGVPPAGPGTPNGEPPVIPGPIEIEIVPHLPDGRPIAMATKPIKISFPNPVDGSCSIINPPGEVWQWHLTYDGFTEPYDPGTIFDPKGQDIVGCCIDGVSNYGATCVNGDPKNLRTLHFPTSYQILSESIAFHDNGTFTRMTMENTNNPVPSESDFCGTGPGVVRDKIKLVEYEGTWEIVPMTPNWWGGDATAVQLTTTSSTGLGFGNPGGTIRQLACDPINNLALITIDLEGGGRDLYKHYFRRTWDVPLPYYPFG